MSEKNYVKYVKPYLEDIKEWIRIGETQATIYKKLGIGETSWYAFKKKYPALEDTIVKGKQNLTEHIESSLYKRCMGYEVEEVKTITGKDSRVEKIRKHIPPSDTAIIFTLCNMRPDKWRRSDKDENSQKDNTLKIEFSDDRIKRAFELLYPVPDTKDKKTQKPQKDNKSK
jgi:hypothetical protein